MDSARNPLEVTGLELILGFAAFQAKKHHIITKFLIG